MAVDDIGFADLGDVPGGFLEGGGKPGSVFGRLAQRAFVLTQQLEYRRRVLALEAFLHVLRGDDRVVVLGDDSQRHGAHLAKRPGAPRAKHRERENESSVTEEELRAKLDAGHGVATDPTLSAAALGNPKGSPLRSTEVLTCYGVFELKAYTQPIVTTC